MHVNSRDHGQTRKYSYSHKYVTLRWRCYFRCSILMVQCMRSGVSLPGYWSGTVTDQVSPLPLNFNFPNVKLGRRFPKDPYLPSHNADSDPHSDRSIHVNYFSYFYDFLPKDGWFHKHLCHQAGYLCKLSPLTVHQKSRKKFFSKHSTVQALFGFRGQL